jgi:hypothetical protein
MMVSVGDVGEVGQATGAATLTAYPPPIIARTASDLWFCVSLPPPRGNASGGVFI